MFKFFLSRLRRIAVPPSGDDTVAADWIRDPLAHPQIEAMGERQRADLPFRGIPSGKVACEAGVLCR
ncbi:hypothetical protein J2Y48_001344 [Mycoplana sp. BE70]|uniref:hypothetical protein n=1 Tax=Mycoplana sp. BE70 TaxID=2817775 RepID=UPI0028612CE1|nr:hypothetical protein [Mycoplana sp. BE70]MDR6756054.1 hypothetical protein [Mycoplana sp. BE70]